MKRPEIETAERKELTDYIEWASKVIDGSSKLQIQLALLCDIIADDIERVSKGDTTALKVLTGEAKLFEQLLAVVKNKSDFAALTLITSTEETTTTKKKITRMQDIVLKPK